MTNETIRKDNKEIRPFYIDCTNLSEDQVNDVVKKSVEAGAILCDVCWGGDGDIFSGGAYPHSLYDFWGVNSSNETYTGHPEYLFGRVQSRSYTRI